MSSLRLFVSQMTSGDQWEANLKNILATLDSVGAQTQTTLVTFPENCLYLRLTEGEKVPALPLDHPAFKAIASKAKELNVNVHLGSVPLQGKNKLVNATVFIAHDGSIFTAYEKVHLFDIKLENAPPNMESDAFEHGSGAAMVDLAGWKIGLSICYDIRFSSLYLQYAMAECDLILVPAAFLVPTGQAHWEVLLRARAIESQAYVAAAAQAGLHKNESGGRRQTFGNSMIIDPWGRILAQGDGEKPVLLKQELTLDAVKKVRAQIPMRSHRKGLSPLRTFSVPG